MGEGLAWAGVCDPLPESRGAGREKPRHPTELVRLVITDSSHFLSLYFSPFLYCGAFLDVISLSQKSTLSSAVKSHTCGGGTI